MTPTFDEKLVDRETPWAACAALEEFFSKGGQCRVSDSINWVGIVYNCSRKASEPTPPQLNAHLALAWSHIAIAIRESMATGYSADDSSGILMGAMWVRANMIIQFGNHPGDSICDCNKLVSWCLNDSHVKQALQLKEIPHIFKIAPEARSIEQLLACLVEEKVIKREGDVARLMDLIADAKQVAALKPS